MGLIETRSAYIGGSCACHSLTLSFLYNGAGGGRLV